MNILHVVPGMDPQLGGVCQAVRTIITGLGALQVRNEVVSLDASDADFLDNTAFPIHALGPARGFWAYSADLLPWLIENLPRFDAVIVHGLWLYYGYAVRRAMERYSSQATQHRQTKFFVMPHGMLDPYFQRAPGRRLKAMRNLAYWKLIEGQLLNNVDGLLFTCEEERQLAQQTFRPYLPKRTVVVGLGVEEPPAFEEVMREKLIEKCPSIVAKSYILFLSRIHEKKGVDLLLKAYERLSVTSLSKEGNYEPFNELPALVVAGPGLETSYGKQMQEMVAQSPILRNRVLFPGMLNGDAKWGAFYGCESFILPSHQENFGIAVVEALACGKPVLISNQVNIWREIEATGSGIAVADTVQGTESLLLHWQSLSVDDQKVFQKRARAGYESNFAIHPAAQRFLQAVGS